MTFLTFSTVQMLHIIIIQQLFSSYETQSFSVWNTSQKTVKLLAIFILFRYSVEWM